jgi:hypothetical protein
LFLGYKSKVITPGSRTTNNCATKRASTSSLFAGCRTMRNQHHQLDLANAGLRKCRPPVHPAPVERKGAQLMLQVPGPQQSFASAGPAANDPSRRGLGLLALGAIATSQAWALPATALPLLVGLETPEEQKNTGTAGVGPPRPSATVLAAFDEALAVNQQDFQVCRTSSVLKRFSLTTCSPCLCRWILYPPMTIPS